MLNFESGKLFWGQIIGVIIIQVIVGLFIFDLYPTISMIFLGEGGNSSLYSNGNLYIWIISPIVWQSLLNATRIYYAFENNKVKEIKAYIIIELALVIIYLIFIIWWGKTHRFHI